MHALRPAIPAGPAEPLVPSVHEPKEGTLEMTQTTPPREMIADHIGEPAGMVSDHAELAKLAEAATPRPWTFATARKQWFVQARFYGGEIDASDVCAMSNDNMEANAAFIAAARAAVPALIAENAALRAEANRTYAEMAAEIHGLQNRATEAERRMAEAEDGLAFYAQPIWSIRGEFPEPSPHSEFRPDCGDRARQVLAKLALSKEAERG
jgi:hypothetical protein